MNKKTIEIRVADLAAMLLKAFKPILCTALIFALLGGGFGLFRALNAGGRISTLEKNLKAAEERAQASEETLDEAERSLAGRRETEIPMALELIRRAEELENSRREYLDSSLYCSLDPFHCGVSRLTLRLMSADADGEDASSAIAAAVSGLFTDSGELLLAVRDIMKTDAELAYVRELVSAEEGPEGLVRITVLHGDPQIAEAAADAVCAELLSRLNGSGSFSSEPLERFCGYEINWEMRDRQLLSMGQLVSAEQSLSDAREQLQRLKESIPDLETAAEKAARSHEKDLNALRQAQRQYDRSLVTPKNIVLRTLRSLLAMLFAGLLLASFVAMFRGIAGDRLQSKSMLLTGCCYPLLGVLPCEKPRLFEKTIRRLEGESDADYRSAASVAAQTLLSLAEDRRVCFVSSLGKEAAELLVSETDGRIPACGDIVDDPDAVRALSTFDSVVLIEKKGQSELSRIDNEILRAKMLGKEILGVVLS